MANRVLGAPFRQSRLLGKLGMADAGGAASVRGGAQGEVHQKGGRPAVMAHQIPHQRVQNIGVQGVALVAHAGAFITIMADRALGRAG